MDTKNIDSAVGRKQSTQRHTAEQRAEFLRQWEASGLTAEAFAKPHSINAQSLYRWRMMEKSAKSSSSALNARRFKEFRAEPRIEAERGREPTITMKSSAFQVSIAGARLDDRLCSFVKALSREVFNV